MSLVSMPFVNTRRCDDLLDIGLVERTRGVAS